MDPVYSTFEVGSCPIILAECVPPRDITCLIRTDRREPAYHAIKLLQSVVAIDRTRPIWQLRSIILTGLYIGWWKSSCVAAVVLEYLTSGPFLDTLVQHGTHQHRPASSTGSPIRFSMG